MLLLLKNHAYALLRIDALPLRSHDFAAGVPFVIQYRYCSRPVQARPHGQSQGDQSARPLRVQKVGSCLDVQTGETPFNLIDEAQP